MTTESGLDITRPAPDVLHLALNRTERRNALDAGLVQALLDAVTSQPAGVIVLASADDRAFCAGVDLKSTDADRRVVSDLLYALYEAMTTSPAVIIAAIDGPAVGGGAQLAVASDLRIASNRASFRFAGPGHGLAVGAWALPALVGRGRALDLCLSMRVVNGVEAHAIGLVERLVEAPEGAALELAAEIAALQGPAVTRVKEIVSNASGHSGALFAEREGNRIAWDGSVNTRS